MGEMNTGLVLYSHLWSNYLVYFLSWLAGWNCMY